MPMATYAPSQVVEVRRINQCVVPARPLLCAHFIFFSEMWSACLQFHFHHILLQFY